MTPRIIPLSIVIALTLAVAGTAEAKNISSVEACGASGCQDVTSATHHDWSAFNFGSTTTSAPKTAAFYKVTIGIGGHDHWSFLFAPSAGKARLPDEPGTYRWLALSPATVQRLERMIGDVKPYPPDRLASTIDASVPRAQVVETYEPARTARDSGGGVDAAPIAAVGALAAIALGGVALARRGRRRRAAGSAA
jgi:hypothetical protein